MAGLPLPALVCHHTNINLAKTLDNKLVKVILPGLGAWRTRLVLRNTSGLVWSNNLAWCGGANQEWWGGAHIAWWGGAEQA